MLLFVTAKVLSFQGSVPILTWEEIIAVRERDAAMFGGMQALIEDNLEEGIPKNKIIKKTNEQI